MNPRAHSRISLCYLDKLAAFQKATIRCCVRWRVPFGISRLLGLGHRSRGASPLRLALTLLFPRFCPFGPVAGLFRTRRCQRSIIVSPLRTQRFIGWVQRPIRRTQLEYQNPPRRARWIFRKYECGNIERIRESYNTHETVCKMVGRTLRVSRGSRGRSPSLRWGATLPTFRKGISPLWTEGLPAPIDVSSFDNGVNI